MSVQKICLKRDKHAVVTFSQASIQSRRKAARIEGGGHQRNSKLWRVTTWEIHSG